jgi:hypothetical protein
MSHLASGIRRHIRFIKWLIPLGLVLAVAGYEIGPARWINESLGFSSHLAAEIILFGTVGPLLVYALLELHNRWLDEKETADVQADLLAKAQRREREIRQLSDNTLQVLFATAVLMATIKSDESGLPPNTIMQIEVTEKAVNDSIEHLRTHLLS